MLASAGSRGGFYSGVHRSLPYQPALDGLRAIAVLAVIFYHGGAPWLPGGFLGVDVFFVLSGYLITTLLVREKVETGGIDLVAFWGRRLRRLFPALLTLLLGVAVYGAVLLTPVEAVRLAGEGFAALFYVSNWHFIVRGTSYFEQFQAPSPLLHTWSLAIEEQWYLLWPLIVWAACARSGGVTRRFLAGVVLAAGASALWMGALFEAGGDPSRVYYGTDTHSQGLLIGSALALAAAQLPARVFAMLARLGIGGAGAVVAAMALTNDRSGWIYQGGLAGFSVATATVIAAAVQPEGLLRRVLSVRPLRGLGAISYGMYLWHWPVLLVLGPERLGLNDGVLLAAALAVTILMAAASYRWIEAPIRFGALSGWRIRVLGAGMIAATASCFLLLGQTARLPPVPAPAVPNGGTGDDLLQVVVLGDSVAWSLASEFRAEEHDIPMHVRNGGRMGCGVGAGTMVYREVERPMLRRCADWPGAWERFVARGPDVVVILIGAWEVVDRLVDGTRYRVFSDDYARYLKKTLGAGIDAVAVTGAEIVLLTTPCFNQQWGRTAAVGGMPAPQAERNDPARVGWVHEVLREFAAERPTPLTVLDLHGATCPNGRTSAPIDGGPLQHDGVHFSPEGATHVWRWLAPQLQALAGRSQ